MSRRQFTTSLLAGVGLGAGATLLPAGGLILEDAADAASTTVSPINFSLLKKPTDTLSAQVVAVLTNTNQFAVTTWWNSVKNYSTQTATYLDFGGTDEYSIRPPAAQSFGLATALALGTYSASATGVSKADATTITTKLIRSLAYRHLANLGSTGWGNTWQSAHWAWFAGQAGWLMWGSLSTTDREYVRKMVEYEANRFLTFTGSYYRKADGTYVTPGDTKAEEVAWNNPTIALAASMMPNHANYKTWMTNIVKMSLDANSVPQDLTTNAGTVVNGYQLGTFLQGSNVDSDYTVINHNRIHPDYVESFAINLTCGLSFSLANKVTPYAVRRGYDLAWAGLVNTSFTAGTMPYDDPALAGQTILQPGGKVYAGTSTDPADTSDIYYPMPNDWGTLRRMQFATMDIFADSFKEDGSSSTKGAYWAVPHLTKVQRMQERSTDRRTYIDYGEDTYSGREEWVSHHAGWSYLARVLAYSGLYRVSSISTTY